jgi:hypothetical protein
MRNELYLSNEVALDRLSDEVVNSGAAMALLHFP